MSDDSIGLRGMRFLGRHGVTLEERMEPQPFEIDVTMSADLAAAAASDELAETIDYAAVFEEARRIVEQSSFRLIETLGQAIIDAVLISQPRVDRVEVRVRKPRAPLPGAIDTVEAVLRRDRQGPR